MTASTLCEMRHLLSGLGKEAEQRQRVVRRASGRRSGSWDRQGSEAAWRSMAAAARGSRTREADDEH